ncbi:MAG: hydrogenase maturation protease [Chloroflexota bacterium]
MKPTLILGYGNVDRQDDGAAWHVLAQLAQKLGRGTTASLEDEFYPEGAYPHLLSALQLTPEMAETVAEYERVCFVDAHTGAIPDEIGWQEVLPEFQQSPFTHHLTPQSCLSVVRDIYHRTPEAVLVSVRGYEFGFERQLSDRTRALVERAVARIVAWLG